MDNIIVIPKRTKKSMSFPFEDPIRRGWVNGLMNWSIPLKKNSKVPKMIRIIPNGMYLFVFIRISPELNPFYFSISHFDI